MSRRCAGVMVLAILLCGRLSAQAVDRAKPPTLPPPPALKLPAIQTATLPSGLTLAVVEVHKVPVRRAIRRTSRGSRPSPR